MLVHIVLARFPNPDDIDEAERRLRELPAKIDVIRSMEIGRDVLRSERSYDIAWVIELDSKEDLHTYAEHPDHKTVAAWISQHRSDFAACDYLR